jgi:RNA polymerase sigma-70 factor (ECF subfamily)
LVQRVLTLAPAICLRGLLGRRLEWAVGGACWRACTRGAPKPRRTLAQWGTYQPRRCNGRTAQFTRRGASLTETADVALSALMAAAQNGDGRAYQALLRACVPYASAVARRQGVAPDRVEDVVQEILLTIHRARATYDPRRPFLPWLRAIAQRRAIDSLRSRYRHGALEIQDDDAARAVASPAPDAGDELARADQNRILAAAVAALPPGQRQAVELLALQETSLEDASGKTGRSKVALKVNLHRAIHGLRKTLVEQSGETGRDAGNV